MCGISIKIALIKKKGKKIKKRSKIQFNALRNTCNIRKEILNELNVTYH